MAVTSAARVWMAARVQTEKTDCRRDRGVAEVCEEELEDTDASRKRRSLGAELLQVH